MAEPKRASGTVKWFSAQKGFGFIAPDDGGDDLFVHQTSICSDGFRTLFEGQLVEFSVEFGEDMRTKAADVAVLDQSRRGGGGGGGGRGAGAGGVGMGQAGSAAAVMGEVGVGGEEELTAEVEGTAAAAAEKVVSAVAGRVIVVEEWGTWRGIATREVPVVAAAGEEEGDSVVAEDTAAVAEDTAVVGEGAVSIVVKKGI